MICNFVPSLKHAATVRVVALLLNDKEMANILWEGHHSRWHMPELSLPIPPERLELIKIKVDEKLSSLVPVDVHDGVIQVTVFFYEEVVKWKWDHEYVAAASSFSCLCWKMNGIIERTETAMRIVQAQSIKPELRFILACTYFFEEEILLLWTKMKEDEQKKIFKEIEGSYKKRILYNSDNAAVRFWMKMLEEEVVNPWQEVIQDYFKRTRTMGMDSPLRLSCFFSYLSWDTKKYYIEVSKGHSAQFSDFQDCVNQLDGPEQAEIFESQLTCVLLEYIKLPFRSNFLEMAGKTLTILTAETFQHILCSLLKSYLQERHSDFNLLAEFWEMGSPEFKEEAKKFGYFIEVTNEVLEGENVSECLKKIVRNDVFGLEV